MSPGFSISYLNGLEPLMHDCINQFTRVLDEKCPESGEERVVVDINRMLGNLTSVSFNLS